MKLLLVEDDESIGRAIHRGLQEAGHQCLWVKDGDSALRQLASDCPQAVILDLMLPDRSGLEVLRQIRAIGNQLPVLVLTALGSVEQRVTGLEAGADDYLTKPFEFVELLARLSAICRRSSGPVSTRWTAGSLVLDLTLRRAVREGVEINLTPTEFSLLEYLFRFRGQTVSRRMLCEHLWDASWEGVTNVIEVHLTRLRSKLDRPFSFPMLVTVRGQGYMLDVAENGGNRDTAPPPTAPGEA
jgi:two-component system OmpR family response regulator/two-component system copper resistance phosphate regulon response regulator CusR